MLTAHAVSHSQQLQGIGQSWGRGAIYAAVYDGLMRYEYSFSNNLN
jgi:hypothetical protein